MDRYAKIWRYQVYIEMHDFRSSQEVLNFDQPNHCCLSKTLVDLLSNMIFRSSVEVPLSAFAAFEASFIWEQQWGDTPKPGAGSL